MYLVHGPEGGVVVGEVGHLRQKELPKTSNKQPQQRQQQEEEAIALEGTHGRPSALPCLLLFLVMNPCSIVICTCTFHTHTHTHTHTTMMNQ